MSIERISSDISTLQETLADVETEITKLAEQLRLLGEYSNEFHVCDLEQIQ